MGVGKLPARRGAVVDVDEPAFELTRLDPAVAAAVGALGEVTELWQALHPTVKAFLPFLDESIRAVMQAEKEGRAVYVTKEGKPTVREAWARDAAGTLTTMLERLSKTLQSLVKAVDEAARLRSFLTGGPTRARTSTG